jgi:regulator of replication initiation timing
MNYEIIAELQAENKRLRIELERLKQQPKPLSAEEVTEPGLYLWRGIEHCKWILQRVSKNTTIVDELGKPNLIVVSDDGMVGCRLYGQFIGPLKVPEV